MRQGSLYLAAAAVLLTVAAGCNKAPQQQGANANTQANTQANANASTSQATSLKDLLAAGTARKCTMTFKTGETASTGTFYIGGGKMRSDFTAQVSGKAYISHMIQDNSNIYTWVDGMPMGFKMAMGQKASVNANSQVSTPDVNQKMNYNCQPWSLDSSVFGLPSGVNFSGAVVPAVPTNSGKGSGY